MGEALREGFGRLLRKGDYIFGSYVKPEAVDGYINGVNPSDRSDVLGRFPSLSALVDHAVEYAAMGYRVWRRLSINDRAGAVHRFREQLLTHQEALAHGITREVGKPLWERAKRSRPRFGVLTFSWTMALTCSLLGLSMRSVHARIVCRGAWWPSSVRTTFH